VWFRFAVAGCTWKRWAVSGSAKLSDIIDLGLENLMGPCDRLGVWVKNVNSDDPNAAAAVALQQIAIVLRRALLMEWYFRAKWANFETTYIVLNCRTHNMEAIVWLKCNDTRDLRTQLRKSYRTRLARNIAPLFCNLLCSLFNTVGLRTIIID